MCVCFIETLITADFHGAGCRRSETTGSGGTVTSQAVTPSSPVSPSVHSTLCSLLPATCCVCVCVCARLSVSVYVCNTPAGVTPEAGDLVEMHWHSRGKK